jgi:hypothetical protein
MSYDRRMIMNKHRKKCDHLKQVRKNVADSLGIDLKQTVCTYEGDCKGTCPKCEYEEKVLSKALLKSTAVVASAALMFTACGKPERIELNLETMDSAKSSSTNTSRTRAVDPVILSIHSGVVFSKQSVSSLICKRCRILISLRFTSSSLCEVNTTCR